MKVENTFRVRTNKEAVEHVKVVLLIVGVNHDNTTVGFWTAEAMHHFAKFPNEYKIAQDALHLIADQPLEAFTGGPDVGHS